MSSKLYKRGQLKWFKIGFRVIANICQQKLNSKEYAEITVTDDPEEDQEDGESITFTNGKAASKKDGRKTKKSREEFLIKIENRNRKRDRIKWRLGLNLYKCCEHYDAYALLEYIASGGFTGVKEREEGRESPIDVRSDVHLYTARCCNELYLLTKNHYHLEAGYRHYKNCIETMGADLSTMFKLPKVLYEFAGLLESYGAFESALQLYSRLLTNFPTFRGYFDTMYRTAIVGKVLAERVSDQKGKDEMLNKCIDIYQFLLEAVPPSINEVGIVTCIY
jgi:hypothetical protein